MSDTDSPLGSSTYRKPVIRMRLKRGAERRESPLSRVAGRPGIARSTLASARLCLLVAVALATWGFALGTLTPDQRQILVWALPLASGFACGSFAGGISAKAQGILPGLLVTATGGFAVWLITSFMLFPSASAPAKFSPNEARPPTTSPTNRSLRQRRAALSARSGTRSLDEVRILITAAFEDHRPRPPVTHLARLT
jgi:hypothetical protein